MRALLLLTPHSLFAFVRVSSGINYLVQPFTMYALARLFFDVFYASILSDEEQDEYIAGCIILGGTPCTAMVFVWSLLTHGDAAYTLVQVAFNDVLIFIFYIPTMMLLLEASSISVPWDTAFLAVGLFLLCPGLLAYGTRWCVFSASPFFYTISPFFLVL